MAQSKYREPRPDAVDKLVYVRGMSNHTVTAERFRTLIDYTYTDPYCTNCGCEVAFVSVGVIPSGDPDAMPVRAIAVSDKVSWDGYTVTHRDEWDCRRAMKWKENK